MMPIISSSELRKINESIEKGLNEVEISLDLGLSKTIVTLSKEGFYYNNELIKIKKIKDDDKSCYLIKDNSLVKLQFMGEDTRKLYKLIPTQFRPILQVSGTSMHKKEFLEKLERDKLTGNILDAGTGLGYSSIILSKTADKVITIEIDNNVLEMAKLNPYSKDLFRNTNIKLIKGNIVEKIKTFKNEEFNFIIFDAGTVKGSEEFFSLENYKEAYRVLKNKGRLYHYLPKHQIKRGRDFGSEVTNRLKKAGFKQIYRDKLGSYIITLK